MWEPGCPLQSFVGREIPIESKRFDQVADNRSFDTKVKIDDATAVARPAEMAAADVHATGEAAALDRSA